METQRLFLAIELPDAIRAPLMALATASRHLRWTPSHQLHLTLRFLGDIDTSAVEPLIARLATIHVDPFLLALESTGAFPPRGQPRVLWAGLAPADPRLFQLRQQIDDTLLALGLDVDLRTFYPHVTLARCGDSAAGAAAQWLRAHRDFAGPPFRVDAFSLFASELHSSGARHTLLRRFPLAPPPAAA